MNRWFILLCTLGATHAFAQHEVAGRASPSQMQSSSGQSSPLVLTSAAPQSKYGGYVFVDALYWHASVGSTEWAWAESTTATFAAGPLESVKFHWNWGVRGGIGYTMDYDQWDTNLYYTWFHTRATDSTAATAAGTIDDLIGATFDQADLYRTGSARWKIHFSMFDWELGRWTFISGKTMLRPHIGLKGGWINHDVRYTLATAAAAITGRYSLDNDFWGIGPCAGMSSSWILGNLGTHRFSLFGDFAGALMFAHFKVSHNESFFNAAGALIDFNRPSNLNLNAAVPMLQGIMGLGYDTRLGRKCAHFTLRAGYELQYWFRQYQQVRGVDIGAAAHGFNRISSDLALQGLTVDVRFDF